MAGNSKNFGRIDRYKTVTSTRRHKQIETTGGGKESATKKQTQTMKNMQ